MSKYIETKFQWARVSDFGIYIRIAFGFRTRALFFRWTIALFGARVDLRLDREKVSLSYYFRLCTGSQTFSFKERLLDSLNRTIRSVSPSSFPFVSPV